MSTLPSLNPAARRHDENPKMNRRREYVLVVTTLLVVATLIFPSWRMERPDNDSRAALGYYPIWDPPHEYTWAVYEIDPSRVTLQLLAILALGGAFFAVAGPRREEG